MSGVDRRKIIEEISGISIYEDNVSAHLFAPTLDTEKMNALLFATSA